MTDILIGTHSRNSWQRPGTTATLRIWFSGEFRDTNNVMVTPGNGTSSFYDIIPCTVNPATHVVTIPAFTLPSTLDGLPANVLSYGRLYDASGAPREFLWSGWSLSNLPTSLPFNSWYIFNQGSSLSNPPDSYLNSQEVIALIDSLLTGISQGVVSEIPSGTPNGILTTFTLSQTPIAGSLEQFQNGQLLQLGVDYTLSGAVVTFTVPPPTGDWLFSVYRTTAPLISTPTTATQLIETGGPTVLNIGAIADRKIFRRSGSTVIGSGYEQTFDSADYASLNAAVTAIGATLGSLLVSAAGFASGNTCTVPSTLKIDWGSEGTLVLTTGQSITIQSDASQWPIRQLFFNALAGQGTIVGPSSVSGRWWGAVGDGITNSKAPIQAAIQCVFASGGGVILFPSGVYIVDGTLDATYNSLLKIPDNGSPGSNPPITVKLLGEFISRTSASPVPTTGVVFAAPTTVGAGTFPSIIAARAYAGTTSISNFNTVVPELENINFRTADNPSLTAMNFHNCIGASIKNVVADPGTDYDVVSQPTNTQAVALIMPGVNNNTECYVENFSAYGYYEGIRCSEHTRFVGRVSVSKMWRAVVIESGFRPLSGDLIIESSPTGIYLEAASTIDLYVSYERWDADLAGAAWYQSVTGQDVTGVGAGLGTIRYKLSLAVVGDTERNLSVTQTVIDFINVYRGNFHALPLVIDSNTSDIYLQKSTDAGVVTNRNMSPQTLSGDSHYTVNAFFNSSLAAWRRNNTALPSWDFYISRASNIAGLRRADAGAGDIVWIDVWKSDNNTAANNTPMFIWDNNSATLKRVSVGVADSGGVGFRLLRIPN